MEANLGQRRKGLEEKIPDIKKTLTMVELLKSRKVCSINTTRAFDLSDPPPFAGQRFLRSTDNYV
jgi:hypothetical protein